MGTILYNDDRIAVCRYSEEDIKPPSDAVIKLLVELSSDNAPGRIEEAITLSFSLACLFDGKFVDEKERRKAIALADADELHCLGFEVNEDSLSKRKPLFFDDMYTFAVSVPHTIEKALEIADYIQYLAKLYLLSEGERTHEHMLPDIDTDKTGMRFDVELPYELARSLAVSRLNTSAKFNSEKITCIEDGRFSVPVTIDYADILRFPYAHSDSFAWLSLEPFELKKTAAAALLSSLINYQSATLFCNDVTTFKLKMSDNDSFASALGKCIINKKITACPHCGKVVFLQRKSSKPFCKPGHQTRYHEEAHAMFDSGASVDEVCEAYPRIYRATIENWQR